MTTKQFTVERFLGIDRTPSASPGSFEKAEGVSLDSYPAVTLGASWQNEPLGEGLLLQLFENPYSDKPIFVSDDYGSKSLNIYVGDTLYTVQISNKLQKAGKYFYDLQAGMVYWMDTAVSAIKTKSLSESVTMSSTVRLKNEVAGQVQIVAYNLGKKAYFEIGDRLHLSCDDWSDNLEHVDAECFADREESAHDTDDYALTYTVENAVVAQASSGYTHTYTCTVTGCGGGLFESPYTQVEFGGSYAPLTVGLWFPSGITDMCVHNNRIACVTQKGDSIRLTSLGSYNCFYDFSGEETDSFFTDVETDGPFVACVSFAGTLVCFKRNTIHVLYGSTPSEYTLAKTIKGFGCIDAESVIESGGRLMFLTEHGYAIYNGACAYLKNVFGKEIQSAKAVTDGIRIYTLQTYTDQTRELAVYDTRYGVWTTHALHDSCIDICFHGAFCQGLVNSNCRRLSEGSGGFSLETCKMYEGGFGKKHQIELRLRISADNPFILVSTQTEDGWHQYTDRITMSGLYEKEYEVRAKPTDWYAWKMEATRGSTNLLAWKVSTAISF